jgi:hypothetical protein
VIDSTTRWDYKECSRGALAVFSCYSRLFRPERRSCEKGSVLDGVLRPSSLLTGSTGADRALSMVWRRLAYRSVTIALGTLGVLAFLLSAVLPDDDALQQECLHGRASLRVFGWHSREAAGNAVSTHISSVFWPAPRVHLVRPHGIAHPLFIAPFSVSERLQSPASATRAPPLSV